MTQASSKRCSIDRGIGIDKHFSYIVSKTPRVKTHHPLDALLREQRHGAPRAQTCAADVSDTSRSDASRT
ncbi:Uncharacterised protein [Burkholderia oklahomensis]|nr:hypothetical protein BG90_3900 [Burkholderia oklahomensis C6786]SUY28611.1 Uncharacterised protein [Burkholderia oklahomensis]